ncbi:GNAT family N-acetyltransferase [Sporosarcina sp. Marseille-Q4063]|uniref:GNAT family N-acetyltransferase n=1 Tax=Sporosarcina sp. Marseille-Q4063 TaxID=2810514 RepID=UPI00352FFCF9
MKNFQLHIETERLIIRPLDMPLSTEAWFVKWINGFREMAVKDDMYILGLFRKEDGVNVGKVELTKILRSDYQWAMMGYSIHNQFWKNGYATESVLAATKVFFSTLGFHRIELHISLDNKPSIQLAERTGFQFECVREKFSFENERWTDFLIYYMTAIDRDS